jgi:hypothetical protein
VVENPEGAGEHVKVPPRRLDAPIPFEMSRVVIPVEGGTVRFVVFAPEHRFAERNEPAAPEGETTTAAFSLDETAKYFLVLVALCEPRLRDAGSVALPTDPQIVERLRPLPSCRDLTRAAVNYHLDYLAGTKLRLRESPPTEGSAAESRRAALVTVALRFNLVTDEHLALLPPPGQGATLTAGR